MSTKHTAVLLAGYEITRDGRIFSTTNWRGLGRRELAQHPNADGYPSVRVTLAGKRVRYAVHSSIVRWRVASSSIQSSSWKDMPLRPGTVRTGPA